MKCVDRLVNVLKDDQQEINITEYNLLLLLLKLIIFVLDISN